MKNQDIITLVNGGILAITAHDIPAAHAYKVVKFKQAVRSAFGAIQEAEREMFKEAGISDIAAFNERLKTLRETLSDGGDELKDMESQLERLNALQNELRGEEAKLDGVKGMPYDVWHLLQNENKAVRFGDDTRDVLSGWTEDVLENILWFAPEDIG